MWYIDGPLSRVFLFLLKLRGIHIFTCWYWDCIPQFLDLITTVSPGIIIYFTSIFFLPILFSVVQDLSLCMMTHFWCFPSVHHIYMHFSLLLSSHIPYLGTWYPPLFSLLTNWMLALFPYPQCPHIFVYSTLNIWVIHNIHFSTNSSFIYYSFILSLQVSYPLLGVYFLVNDFSWSSLYDLLCQRLWPWNSWRGGGGGC